MIGVLLACTLLAGCTSESKPPRSAKVTSPTTTQAPTTTTPQPKLIYAHTFSPEQQEVAKGYFAADTAHLLASEHPTHDPSGLANTHVGAMLAAARKDVAALARDHRAVRLPANTKSLVRVDAVRIAGETAIIDVCTIDDAVFYALPDGQLVDSDVVSHKRRGTLRRFRHRWKLLYRTSDAKQPGAVACQS